MLDVKSDPLPSSPLYRVAYSPDPFVPPDWGYAKRDGTFGGRYDDPRGRRGVPPHERYRVLYYASDPSGAYGETIAQFRPSLKTLAGIGGHYPFGSQPAVPRDWRIARRIGTAVLAGALPMVDIEDAATVQALRPVLAPVAARLGLHDIDLSAISGPERELTQEAALHVYSQVDANGDPQYAGIRYVSRLNHGWECWAVFADRFLYVPQRVAPIDVNDPYLHAAAHILRLAIEDDRGALIVPVAP